MARVFLSHAHEDSALASDIQRWLAREGHQVFLDRSHHDGLTIGDEWEQRLYERLRWADAVVCTVTAAYVASVWCAAEVAIARSRGSRLLPLLIEPGVDHPLLRSVQHADYAGDPHTARSALIEALRHVDAAGGLGWPDGRSPFPGLQAFDTDMHRAFFGRGTEVATLAALLRSPAAVAEPALTVVVGPSGCGKSSLVRAGLLPAMAAEAEWLTLPPFPPGPEPLAALARELAGAARQLGLAWTVANVREKLTIGDGLVELAEELLLAASRRRRRRRLLLVIDQFEEVLTQATPAGRAEFAEVLRAALGGPVEAVATLRSDSLPDLLVDMELSGLQVRPFTLRPMRPDTLPAVIEGPARLAGIEVDQHLVHRLVADTGTGEALPLLAFTLAELARDVGRGGRLSGSRYDELGGAHGALTRQADAALVAAIAASGRARDDVIAGLLRLVTVDERGAPTPWRVRSDELPVAVRVELDAFVAARLLTTDTDEGGEAHIGVAHAAFLTAWPPLADAIVRAAATLRARRALERSATEWDESGMPTRKLWEGNQLALADEVTRTDLSPRARAFLRSSRRRDRWRRARATTLLSVLLVLAVVAAGVAVLEQQEAVRQQRAASARALTAEADGLRESQPRLSLMLSVEAMRIDPSGDARASLLASLTQGRYAGRLSGHSDAVSSVAFGPDGRTLATGSLDGAVVLWDLAERGREVKRATLRDHVGPVNAVALSPDGHTLAGAGGDRTTVLWDVTQRGHPFRLAVLAGHEDAVDTTAFSPDGRLLATGSWDGTVALWDLTNRDSPRRLATLDAHAGLVTAVAFSPDGSTLASGNGDTAILWNLAHQPSPTPRATLSGGSGAVTSVAFSPDGGTLAVGTGDTATLWDVAGALWLATLPGHTNVVSAVSFSPDGHLLATGSWDGTTILWEPSDRRHPSHLATLTGHTGQVAAVAFSIDGRTVVTGGHDHTAILWDLADRGRPAPMATLAGHAGAVNAVAFRPDGRILATGGADQAALLWDLADRAHPTGPARLGGHSEAVTALAFSPDGSTLATASNDRTVSLRDLAGLAGPAGRVTLNGHTGVVTALAFGPHGNTVATASSDRTAILWDITNPIHPERVATLTGHTNALTAVAFSPDGRTLATASSDGTAILWDIGDRAHARLATLARHTDAVTAVSFSPDGHTLATASNDQTAMLWDLGDRRHPARRATIGGHTDFVRAVAFSPDGRLLATASSDRTAVVWDLADLEHPSRLATLAGHTDVVGALAFASDGRTLATSSGDGSAMLWDLTDVAYIARNAVPLACAIAGPTISRADWARYVTGVPYERICP